MSKQNMYEYGYYVGGKRVVLGSVSDNMLEAKQREIKHANKIDPASRWFIESDECACGNPKSPESYCCTECIQDKKEALTSDSSL